MISFATDRLLPDQRVDAFCEALRQSFLRMTLVLDRDAARGFDARLEVHPAGGGIWMRASTSTSLMRRTARDIDDTPRNLLILYRQGPGEIWFGRDLEAKFVARPGDLVLVDSQRPLDAAPLPGHRHEVALLTVPFERVEPLLDRSGLQPACVLPRSQGVNGLLGGWFDTFCEQAPWLDAQTRDATVQSLVHLAAIAQGRLSPEAPGGKEALRAARLHHARQYIESHLHRPGLNAAEVARAVGISLRQLHLVFEPTGVSFARYLLQRRLERACELLVMNPKAKVIDVAGLCGFESAATFYRGFRRAFGHAPDELRAASRMGELREMGSVPARIETTSKHSETSIGGHESSSVLGQITRAQPRTETLPRIA